MDFIEALKILGIAETASSREVQEAYRHKAKIFHPDMDGGSSEELTELNRARDIALKSIAERQALILIKEDLPELAHNMSVTIFQQQSERIKNKLKTRRSSRLIRLKNLSAICGLALAGMVAFAQLSGMAAKPAPTLQETAKSITPAQTQHNSRGLLEMDWSIIPGVYAALFGIMFAYLKFRIESISIRIDDYSESLSNIRYCVLELAKLLDYNDAKYVTLESFTDNNNSSTLTESFRSTFGNLTAVASSELSTREGAPLIFKKAEEHKLLKKVEFDSSSPSYESQYEVLFSPSTLIGSKDKPA